MTAKKWYTSKTLWFNSVLAFFMVIEASLEVFKLDMDPRWYVILVAAVAAVNMWLRIVTRTKVTK